jgi:1-phosphofructokinase
MADSEADGPDIGVLAPWPIFTVTVESGPEGADDIYFHAGGQGFWVARMIANLGGRPILCGPIGGESGIVVRALVEAEGIDLHAIPIRGWNGGYVHDRRGGERNTVARRQSPRLDRHERDNLYDAILSVGIRTGVAVLTGVESDSVLGGSFYGRLALDLGDNGVSVVADVSDGALAALEGGVTFLKVSHEELIEMGRCRDSSDAAVRESLDQLYQESGATNVIVSRADAPSLARAGDRLLRITAPRFRALDHRGAGDSMTAALAVAQARGLTIDESLRLAAAAGALNATRHGLGTGNLADIQDIAARVAIEEIAG